MNRLLEALHSGRVLLMDRGRVLAREDESRTMILLVIDMLHDIARAQETQSAVA